ncbi:hypothetical protein HQ529_01425 [Candidatus Woesearchaeota archaeon]|nr:hypothetical protein [Candidatus Woesearchaeota archaeon]
MKILVFGNPELENDSLAMQIADEIDGFEFIKCNNPDDILLYSDEDFYIMDVVKGIKDVTIIDDLSVLKHSNFVSLHDFDLGYFLKLLEKLGRLKKIKIIGLPQFGSEEIIIEQFHKLLQ